MPGILKTPQIIPNRTISEQLGISLETNDEDWSEDSFLHHLERWTTNIDSLIHQYQPNMPTLKEVSHKVRDIHGAGEQSTRPLIYFLQDVNVFQLGLFSYFKHAVLQVASNANSVEHAGPWIQHPLYYVSENTQGSRSQMLDPLAALARYTIEIQSADYIQSTWQGYFGYKKNISNRLNSHRKAPGCDALHEWRNEAAFLEIFEEKDGFLHPRPGRAKAAIHFLKKQLPSLRLNVERINPYSSPNRSMIQVLTFPFALGEFAGEQFERPASSETEEEQSLLKEATELLLVAQYEYVANIAIIEAKNKPNFHIPLILTPIGHGQFGNAPAAIHAGIFAAVKKVERSGLSNIVCCILSNSNELKPIQVHLRNLGFIGTFLTPTRLESSAEENSMPIRLNTSDTSHSTTTSPLLPVPPSSPTDPSVDSPSTCSTLFWAFIRSPFASALSYSLILLGSVGMVCSILGLTLIMTGLSLMHWKVMLGLSCGALALSSSMMALKFFAPPSNEQEDTDDRAYRFV